jgi:uncharacterized protein (DUF952 family)
LAVPPSVAAPRDCIYHLLPQADWERARGLKTYEPASLAAEGFIHCSTLVQLVAVAERYFAGREDMIALRIDPSGVAVPVRYEESEPGQLFPHVYGPLDLRAVIEAQVLKLDSLQRPILPAAWHTSAAERRNG